MNPSIRKHLQESSSAWLITGVAGFIGSHILETLLLHGQQVVGLDDFSTGRRENLTEVRRLVGEGFWKNFRLIEGDISDPICCKEAVQSCRYVLHQAALGSVPQSITNPELTHRVNDSGFLNILVAAKEARVRQLVYASSCAVYGNTVNLPLAESFTPSPMSPYAASKACNETYAQAFFSAYGLKSLGLRYFNVFGERQDPNGSYAAVIPRWIDMALRGDCININGDGLQTRDFIYVKNIVSANISAALHASDKDCGVINVGSGNQTTLIDLLSLLQLGLRKHGLIDRIPEIRSFPDRPGDIRFSQADITRYHEFLSPKDIPIEEGLERTILWYADKIAFANTAVRTKPSEFQTY